MLLGNCEAGKNKHVFVKAQVSSFVSTLTDFLLAYVCNRFLGMWYLFSSSTGTITGGCCNFLLGRYWVFRSTRSKQIVQAGKYLLVWLGNIGLNIGGVYLLTENLHIHFMISKVITAIIIGVFYNFILQRFFVFRI